MAQVPYPDLHTTNNSSLLFGVFTDFGLQFSMVSLLVKEKVSNRPRSLFFVFLSMRQLYINEVVLGTAFGVIFGPYCANIFNPRSWGDDTNTITLEVMRVTLAAGLFAIGVELPKAYLAEHVKSLLVMVVPTMAFGWVIVAGTSQAFILLMPLSSCVPSRYHCRAVPFP